MCDFIIWETYIIYGDFYGIFLKLSRSLTKRSGIYPNIFKSSQNKLNQYYKFFRPLQREEENVPCHLTFENIIT